MTSFAVPIEHGKPGTYKRKRCRCELCTKASTKERAAQRALRARVPPDAAHGNVPTYNRGCRCGSCCRAKQQYDASRRSLPGRKATQVHAEVKDYLRDIAAWAEGDVIAQDGVTLGAEDLVRDFAVRIGPALMEFYDAKFKQKFPRREFLRRQRFTMSPTDALPDMDDDGEETDDSEETA